MTAAKITGIVIWATLLGGTAALYGQETEPVEKPKHFEFRGYLKNLQIWSWPDDPDLISNDGFLHNRLIFKYTPDSNWTFDAEVRNRAFYGETAKAFTDIYADLLDKDPGYWDGSFIPLKSKAVILNTQIDRLWAGYERNNWEVRLGRQRINWGIATTWNPNDLFNAYNFLDFDYEERPGSDALRIKRSFGGFSALEAAVSPARDKKRWVGAIRYTTNWKQFDFQWIGGRYQDQWTAGFGWAGHLGQAGFKGEAGLFKPEQRDSSATLSLTMQVDHLFPHEFYLSAGFLYAGAAANEGFNPAVQTLVTVAPDRLMPVRWSFVSSLAKPISPILTASLTLVYSPKGNLVIAIPALACNIADNWDIDLTAQIFRSEYAAVYLRTRWSF